MLVVLAALGGAGCSFRENRSVGDDGGLPPLEGLASIRVEPPLATVTLDGLTPGMQAFRALGAFDDGHEEDITTRVAWSTDRPGIAGITAGGLASTGLVRGGAVAVVAQNGELQGLAQLLVKVVIGSTEAGGDPAPPADPAGKFAGTPDKTRAPELVYPNDGVLLPPNLFFIEIHFRPGNPANKLFEIAFANEVTDVRVYTRCQPLADGCVYLPSQGIWSFVAETNRGGKPVNLTVRGTDDAGTAVGTSTAFKVQFSEDVLRGALYYWTTSGGTGVMRWNFGDLSQKTAEKVVGTEFSGGKCVGCHALSHDGSKMILSAGGQNDGRLLLLDVAKKIPLQPFPLAQKSQFESWNPDGSAFVGVYGDGGEKDLLLFDGATGARTGTIGLGGIQGDHPDWQNDGLRIALTKVGEKHTDQRPGKGEIAIIERTGASWSAPQVLVPASPEKNHYYPAISPDRSFVVYDQSTCPAGKGYDKLCNGDTDPSARLWAVRLPPGAPSPVELARGNAAGVADKGKRELTNSFPKWSPFVFTLSEQRKLLWLTVSSSRQYGLRQPPAGGDENPTGTLLWMIGVEPEKLLAGQDPSSAAFCLPFQDIATSNHIAQWTSDVPKID